MKGKIITSVTLLCALLPSYGKSLLISTPDGMSGIPLKEIREITFSPQSFSIITQEGNIGFAYDDVSEMTFGDNVSGIYTSSQSLGLLNMVGNRILTSDFSEIIIYNITGIPVMNGIGSIDISRLPQGVYIATTGVHTLKFRK